MEFGDTLFETVPEWLAAFDAWLAEAVSRRLASVPGSAEAEAERAIYLARAKEAGFTLSPSGDELIFTHSYTTRKPCDTVVIDEGMMLSHSTGGSTDGPGTECTGQVGKSDGSGPRSTTGVLGKV
jgi:hypothetical protein